MSTRLSDIAGRGGCEVEKLVAARSLQWLADCCGMLCLLQTHKQSKELYYKKIINLMNNTIVLSAIIVVGGGGVTGVSPNLQLTGSW